MNIPAVPGSIWRVAVDRQPKLTRVFTTRDEVRDYRRTLRGQGFTRSQVTNTRYPVGTGTHAKV